MPLPTNMHVPSSLVAQTWKENAGFLQCQARRFSLHGKAAGCGCWASTCVPRNWNWDLGGGQAYVPTSHTCSHNADRHRLMERGSYTPISRSPFRGCLVNRANTTPWTWTLGSLSFTPSLVQGKQQGNQRPRCNLGLYVSLVSVGSFLIPLTVLQGLAVGSSIRLLAEFPFSATPHFGQHPGG
jgi:hypothetical protein